MDTNLLVLVCLAVVVAIMGITLFAKSKKVIGNDTTPTPIKVLEIVFIVQQELEKAFEAALELRLAEEQGFDSVKKYVIDNVIKFVKETELLTQEQKDYFDDAFVEKFLTPILKQLWKYKLESPNKNMTKASLAKAKVELFESVEE